jgi:hypothetical protein
MQQSAKKENIFVLILFSLTSLYLRRGREEKLPYNDGCKERTKAPWRRPNSGLYAAVCINYGVKELPHVDMSQAGHR